MRLQLSLHEGRRAIAPCLPDASAFAADTTASASTFPSSATSASTPTESATSTSTNASGACAPCHSIDAARGSGRLADAWAAATGGCTGTPTQTTVVVPGRNRQGATGYALSQTTTVGLQRNEQGGRLGATRVVYHKAAKANHTGAHNECDLGCLNGRNHGALHD